MLGDQQGRGFVIRELLLEHLGGDRDLTLDDFQHGGCLEFGLPDVPTKVALNRRHLQVDVGQNDGVTKQTLMT